MWYFVVLLLISMKYIGQNVSHNIKNKNIYIYIYEIGSSLFSEQSVLS
jgi:hypothetical protein